MAKSFIPICLIENVTIIRDPKTGVWTLTKPLAAAALGRPTNLNWDLPPEVTPVIDQMYMLFQEQLHIYMADIRKQITHPGTETEQ